MKLRFAIFLVAPCLAACGGRSIKDDFCHSDAVTLAAAIGLFHLYTGSIPNSAQGLEALVTRPVDIKSESKWVKVMDKLPGDPWGNAFLYLPDCTARPQRFSIVTLGRDEEPSADDRVFKFVMDEVKGFATERD